MVSGESGLPRIVVYIYDSQQYNMNKVQTLKTHAITHNSPLTTHPFPLDHAGLAKSVEEADLDPDKEANIFYPAPTRPV